MVQSGQSDALGFGMLPFREMDNQSLHIPLKRKPLAVGIVVQRPGKLGTERTKRKEQEKQEKLPHRKSQALKWFKLNRKGKDL
jgi:hypothetical protein